MTECYIETTNPNWKKCKSPIYQVEPLNIFNIETICLKQLKLAEFLCIVNALLQLFSSTQVASPDTIYIITSLFLIAIGHKYLVFTLVVSFSRINNQHSIYQLSVTYIQWWISFPFHSGHVHRTFKRFSWLILNKWSESYFRKQTKVCETILDHSGNLRIHWSCDPNSFFIQILGRKSNKNDDRNKANNWDNIS